MTSKKTKKGGKSKKKGGGRPSMRKRLQKMQDQKAGANTGKGLQSDPVGSLEPEWFKNGKNADKWKEKWECMMQLMEVACGDGFGKASMPDCFDPNPKAAADVLVLFSRWMNNENHIFTRQHMLRLLVPFGKSYDKKAWKKCNSIAEGIMLKQWMEKKPGFQQFPTLALIAVYEGTCMHIFVYERNGFSSACNIKIQAVKHR